MTLYNFLEDYSKVRVSLFSQVTGEEEMASGCARGSLGWLLGRMSSVKGWLSIGMDSSGR